MYEGYMDDMGLHSFCLAFSDVFFSDVYRSLQLNLLETPLEATRHSPCFFMICWHQNPWGFPTQVTIHGSCNGCFFLFGFSVLIWRPSFFSWWFHIFFYVPPYLGKWSNLTTVIILRWVVKPPTSFVLGDGAGAGRGQSGKASAKASPRQVDG